MKLISPRRSAGIASLTIQGRTFSEAGLAVTVIKTFNLRGCFFLLEVGNIHHAFRFLADLILLIPQLCFKSTSETFPGAIAEALDFVSMIFTNSAKPQLFP